MKLQYWFSYTSTMLRDEQQIFTNWGKCLPISACRQSLIRSHPRLQNERQSSEMWWWYPWNRKQINDQHWPDASLPHTARQRGVHIRFRTVEMEETEYLRYGRVMFFISDGLRITRLCHSSKSILPSCFVSTSSKVWFPSQNQCTGFVNHLVQF